MFAQDCGDLQCRVVGERLAHPSDCRMYCQCECGGALGGGRGDGDLGGGGGGGDGDLDGGGGGDGDPDDVRGCEGATERYCAPNHVFSSEKLMCVPGGSTDCLRKYPIIIVLSVTSVKYITKNGCR